MAIALDDADGGPFSFGSGSATWGHTCTGSNLILIVHVGFQGGSPAVTGVTYNGVAMTLGSFTTTGGIRNEWWYLMNPATGLHNIVVSYSGTPTLAAFRGLSFTGVDTGVAPASAGTTSGTSSLAVHSGPPGFNPNFGVWTETWIAGGLGFEPSAPITGLSTKTVSIGLTSGGGASIPGQSIWEVYGAVGSGPMTPTITANNFGDSYSFTANGLYLAEASTDIFLDVTTMAVNAAFPAENNDLEAPVDTMAVAVSMFGADMDSGMDVDRMQVQTTMFPVTLVTDVPPVLPGGLSINAPVFRRRYIWPVRGLFPGF